jgi:simple sugar transport system permease protein
MQLQPEGLGVWGIAVALAGGAMRGSIPYMFVSLGECLTEKSGKINLGMEGILLMGAMTAFAVSELTGSPWMGVLAAAGVGLVLGAIHAWLTQQPAVSDVAAGIAMIIFGSGLAFFFGKRFVAPMAPQLPLIDLGGWSHVTAIQSALRISPLFFIGIALAFFLHWIFTRTSWGLKVRAAGDDPQAARALGINVNAVRFVAITAGGALAAVGGAHLTLYFPGIWSEGISGGQGLMAVALVIFAKWSPVGIEGVSGNGQRELVEVIAGQRGAVSGQITVDGELHRPTRAMLRKHQFYTLPEEPLKNAAVARMSVAENMAFGVFDQAPFQRGGSLLDRAAVVRLGRDLIARFSVRPPLPDAPIGELSGGNVQRAILARELSNGKVRVLVAANPCFGLDFKAVDFIHERLRETRNQGGAVLLVSEDLDELLELADRILVMSGGRIVHETTPEAADTAVIGRQMACPH